MIKNKHNIQKVFLEIDTSSMAMANSIKNNLAVFIQNELVPILEKQFNLVENTENQIIQIEKLEISINQNTDKTAIFLSNNEVKNDIKNQIETKIYIALSELKKSIKRGEKNSKFHTISSHDKDLKTLLYFIENGTMPWWVLKEDEILFLKKINTENLKKDAFRIPFQKLIQQKKNQKRIINQFNNQEIAVFISALLSSETQQKLLLKNNLLKFLNQHVFDFKVSFWQLIFDVLNEQKTINIIAFYYQKQTEFLSKELSFELFIQYLKAFLPLNISENELRKMNENYLCSEKTKQSGKPEFTIEKTKNKKENNSSDTSVIKLKNENHFQEEKDSLTSCYVQNAGLIILHPFLKEMLKNCNLIGENNNILNKELAVHILHYAATKKENDYEHLMLFEKFLCGIEFEESIQREIRIEEKHKQQVEEMLLSVIEHWSALKSTSIDILRTEFLQREGKLEWSESNPKLTIERKTQDLLLEKIPWNINIIKIPWMKKLIYTQW